MKQFIETMNIRVGDRILWEADVIPKSGIYKAEYVATQDRYMYTDMVPGKHYLLERPFNVKPGTVIGNPFSKVERAVLIPTSVRDAAPWLGFSTVGDDEPGWFSDDWAKERLEDGWIVMELDEGVFE